MPAMPIADSSAPMVVGIRHTSRATRTRSAESRVRNEAGERLQGDDHQWDEDEGESGQQDRQRDLVGSLLPFGALDQSDHPIQEGLARLGGDADDDAIGQDAGTAGDRGAVATGLADHRRRFSGDRRFVD